MDIVGIIYTIFGVTFLIAIFIMLGFVAGKDILMAFKRKFDPYGCDVWIANSNKNMSHYYLRPKDGKFKIQNLPYITNPEKTMNYADLDKLTVVDSIMKKEKRINEKLAIFEKNKEELQQMLKEAKNDQQKFQIQSQIKKIESDVADTKELLDTKQENYYNQRRAAYFYIEGDPIPKDLFEWYSAVDAKILDNTIARSITQPQEVTKQQEQINKLRILLLMALAAAGAAAILALQNSSGITALCEQAGLKCALF